MDSNHDSPLWLEGVLLALLYLAHCLSRILRFPSHMVACSESMSWSFRPVPLHRSLPKHERLVDLHGSVIDYSYGGGSSIAVLLIMERLHRDLYTGLKVRPRKESQPQAPFRPFILSGVFRIIHFIRHLWDNQVLLPAILHLKKLNIFCPSLYRRYCNSLLFISCKV